MGEDCPFPDVIKTVPHIAFEVENLDETLENFDLEIIIPPNSFKKSHEKERPSGCSFFKLHILWKTQNPNFAGNHILISGK